MALDFKISQPVEYYRKFLEQDLRPDGRELGDIRPTTLNIGSISSATGSSLVKLGSTTVICGITAELTSPKTESPTQGFIVPNVDLPPLCSREFRPGPPSEQAQIASHFMEDIINCSKCIDLQELCIQEGKCVWVLYCDLMCLDYDGSLLDACVIALLAALKDLQLPKVILAEETHLPEVHFSQKTGIKIHSQPVSTSFAIFDDKIIITDPTREESSLATGSITIVTTDEEKIAMVHKVGGTSVTEQQLQACISRAHSRGTEVRMLVDETVLTVYR